jgi:hypothetical protein
LREHVALNLRERHSRYGENRFDFDTHRFAVFSARSRALASALSVSCSLISRRLLFGESGDGKNQQGEKEMFHAANEGISISNI